MERAADGGGIGFRRWYERRLIEGHAWLVTGVLCLVAAFASLEAMSFRGAPAALLGWAVLMFGAGALAIHGFGRYQSILQEAERLADCSTCPACKAYGRFRVPRLADGAPFEAHCMRCGHRWRIE
jgi:hypothetical protein